MSAKRARRELLRIAALAPFLLLARRSEAAEYASAAEVLDAVDRLEADVAARLRAVAAMMPGARAFTASLLRDQARHRDVRARLRRRLGLAPAAAGSSAAPAPADLPALRSAQEALVYAHVEGLPAVGDALAVDAMAKNMVDLARHLTVIDLWLELEDQRG